ncbi:MAG: ribonuclease P protein component [Oscillospiraceae bacterium]|jgi:ribonuclease P protein component|nr:ribonuclease P protein component [Oscillospiraceae bacterium]
MSQKKIVTLNQNSQFKRLYSKGSSFVSYNLITYIKRNNLNISRVGITASKKVGISVKRNRAKRIIKSSYMKLFPQIKSGFDIVFVARYKTCYLKTQDIYENMFKHLRNAHLIDEKIYN